MKREHQSLTVHLRAAAHRISNAETNISHGMVALHCGRVLALTRGNTSKIRKLFFSDPLALEDRAVVLERNLSPTDRRQAGRTAKFARELENLYETAGRLKAKLETCYVKVKRFNVRVAAEEKKAKRKAQNRS